MIKNMPIYKRIAEDIRRRIFSNDFKENGLLPTEQELQQTYEASRTTIRSAVGLLEVEGLVSRQQGRGTAIVSRPATQQMNSISSFSEALSEQGLHPTTGLLHIRKIRPSAIAARKLEISEDTSIYVVQRTKLVEGTVVGYLNNRIVADIVPDLERHDDDLRRHGLYEVLESTYHLEFLNAIETISVHMSALLENDIFEVDESIPLFCSERITRLGDGRAFEYVTTHVRAENFTYRVVLNGRRETSLRPP
jgi:GntR family transcriptional regulator